MRLLRRRLSWMLGGWLVFQCAGIIAPVVLSATGWVAVSTCTCPAAAHGAACPMHHADDRETTGASRRCVIENAAAPIDIALLSLAGGGGLLPRPMIIDRIDPASEHVASLTKVPSSHTELPDAPPPRA